MKIYMPVWQGKGDVSSYLLDGSKYERFIAELYAGAWSTSLERVNEDDLDVFFTVKEAEEAFRDAAGGTYSVLEIEV